jgi:hypothetical protein
MENFTRLELFCRLFLGLFVGFFCVTAALFVRYKAANPLAQVTLVQSRSASQSVATGAPAKAFASASRSQPATLSLAPEQSILITSSTSTVVTFLAALVAHVMNWSKGKRSRRPAQSGAPPTHRPTSGK